MKSNSFFRALFILGLLSMFVGFGCVVKKKKGEVSKLSKFYHNVTSEYNGYFNANELYIASIATLREKNNDNYTKLLDVYDYVSVPDPKIVNPDLDKAIEKVTRVAALHEIGDWVDDCYVLMGKSQYLKQDYEKAEETFEFFEEEFNPSNPFGKNYVKKKLSSKAKKAAADEKKKEEAKVREKEKKKADKEREEKKENQEKEREEKKEKQEEVKKEKEKSREEKIKDQKKEREASKKERQKAIKDKKKTGKSTPPKSKREAKTDSTAIKRNLEKKKEESEKTLAEKEAEKKKEEEALARIEEALAEEEAKKEAEDKKKKKEKAEDKTAYNEGLLWLAKSYIRTEQYSSADFILNRLEKTEGLRKEVKSQLPVVMADLLIKQKDYVEAVPYLEQAIKLADSKNDKARYAYIAGQIMQMDKNYGQAVKYYSTAKSKAKDFTLKFMSELSAVKADALSGGRTWEQTIVRLEKFIKEEKYSEFKDQIYFAMGEVALENDRSKAKEYFMKSSGANTGNKSLKTETCYILAEINLKDKEYTKSKLYYDSTLANLQKLDNRYFYVKNMANNLNSIAKNVMILQKTDSLLAMGEMSKEELLKIAKRRKENEIKNGAPVEDKPKGGLKSGLIPRGVANVNSNFFAYNISAVEAGKSAFKSAWGNIKLEDHWRRSNKSYVQNSTENQNVDVVEETKAEEEMSDAEFKRLMSDVPLNPFQKEALKNERKVALYELGKDYRDKLQEYELSANTLETYLKDFPGTDKEPEVYYYLYLDYQDLGKGDMVSKFKQMMNTKYPNDKYSKLANDPNFLDALNADAKKLDSYYDQTYDLFKKAQYPKVITRVQTAIDAYGKENKLVAKFSLLNAMCLGATQGKEAYVKALQEVTLRYPKTPEETKAKEILRFLNGDGTAFENIDVKEIDNIFTIDDNANHYVAIVLFSFNADILDKSKISVSDYNKLYHSSQTLQLGDVGLSKDEGTQIILVRTFENKAIAMKYYEGVAKSKEEYINGVGYDIYPITKANYRKLLENKTHKKYKAFFEKNYLNK